MDFHLIGIHASHGNGQRISPFGNDFRADECFAVQRCIRESLRSTPSSNHDTIFFPFP